MQKTRGLWKPPLAPRNVVREATSVSCRWKWGCSAATEGNEGCTRTADRGPSQGQQQAEPSRPAREGTRAGVQRAGSQAGLPGHLSPERVPSCLPESHQACPITCRGGAPALPTPAPHPPRPRAAGQTAARPRTKRGLRGAICAKAGDGPFPGNRRPCGGRGSIAVVSVHTPAGRSREEAGAGPGQAGPRAPRWAGSSLALPAPGSGVASCLSPTGGLRDSAVAAATRSSVSPSSYDFIRLSDADLRPDHTREASRRRGS